MQLTVLGKYGPYGKAGVTATSCYLVQQNNTNLLLDMGSGSLCRLLKMIDIKDLNGIFISHLHYDHTSDLLAFRYLLEDISYPINIFVQYDPSEWYKILFDHKYLNIINIDEDTTLDVGDFHLSFYNMRHTVNTLAVKISGDVNLVYTGDTMYNENILKACKDSQYLLADCSKPSGFKGPHMTIDDAVFIKNNTSVKIFATHLNPDYSPKEAFAPYKEIEVVNELQTYDLK